MPYRYSPPISMYVDPQRVATASLLTKRYEENFAADSMLSQQLSQMQVSPLPNDRKIATELRKQFDQSLQERASRGDYHNMSRQVLLDANQFVKSYQPLKQNHDAYQGYRQGLDEQVEKGKITRDIANNSVAMSLYNNNGLTLDESSQIDQNSFFSGYKPAEYVNIREEQFKIAEKMVQEKYQGAATIRQSVINGQLYDVIVEGQIKESISAQRIQQAIAPLKQDPKVAAYLNQESLFRTYNLDDQAIGAMLQEYAGDLRTQGSTQASAELKAMFNLQASEVEKAINDNPREMARLLITNQLFDQASQSTINTFAFQSVYGGGVKSAKINDVWFEGWKERQKGLSGEGFDMTTDLKERAALTPSKLEGALADASKQINDQIESLKEIAGYQGSLTANQILAGGDIPQEIENYFALHQDVKHKITQSLRSAQNRLTSLQSLQTKAKDQAQQTLEGIFQVVNTEYRDKVKNMLPAYATGLNFDEFVAASNAYNYYKQNYWETSTLISDKGKMFERTSNTSSSGKLETEPLSQTFKKIEEQFGLRRGSLEILEKIPEFRNSFETTSRTYADAVGSLALPSQAVRATMQYAGSKAVNEHLSGKMPSSLVFETWSLYEDFQITGAQLAQAGAVIESVALMTQPLNGQLGYQVTIGRADKSTPIDEEFMEGIGGSTTLLLLGDQIRTAGLEAVSNDPMNILITDLDAFRLAGNTSGPIQLTGGYTLDVNNFEPDNMFGANVRVRETVSGEAVLPVVDQVTGTTSYIKVPPSDPRYSLTQMPMGSPLFIDLINRTNDAGLPGLIYGQ
jgi:hypothetical protein